MDPMEWCLFPMEFIGKSYSQLDESIRSMFPSITKGENDSVIFVLQSQSGVVALHPSSFMLYLSESCCSETNDPTLLNVLSVYISTPRDL